MMGIPYDLELIEGIPVYCKIECTGQYGPCVFPGPFSISRLGREGLAGASSILFFEFVRVVSTLREIYTKHTQPKYKSHKVSSDLQGIL